FALATAYLNLGSDFGDLKNYDSSLYYLNKSLILLDTNEKSDNLGLIYIGMAHVNRKLKKYSIAIRYNQSALNVYLDLGIPESTSVAYNGLSELYYELKNYPKALEYLNLAEEINKANLLNDDLLTGYENKAKVYEKLNDPKNEILYLKKHADLKDSILKENHNIQIIELQTQYETEKKEKEIIKLNKDNKIQELQLEKDSETTKLLTTIIISVVLVLLLLGVLTAFLIKTINERKKAYIKLQEKNIEIQSQGEKLNKQSKLIARYQSQMNPHFIFNALNNIQGFVINNEKEKTINQLQLFSTLMRQTLNNSENETISLEKEINYLKTYLDFEQQRFENKIEMEVVCTEDTDGILIPPMMIQPFIENVFKHAGLQTITDARIILEISIEENLLKIEIKDNGKGIDLSNDSLIKNSHAISIIRSRLQILFQASNLEIKKDYFSITSKPILDRGTVIKFYLPLVYKY
ncbi:MAG: histidine kinase, partial [Bacteroidia bacterium]